MNKQKLSAAIAEFVKKKTANAAYYSDNWKERSERKSYYQSFTEAKLLAMTEDDFLEYISKLWSMLIWGNKKYVVDKIVADNGFGNVKKQLADLLYGDGAIEKKMGHVFEKCKGARSGYDQRIVDLCESAGVCHL